MTKVEFIFRKCGATLVRSLASACFDKNIGWTLSYWVRRAEQRLKGNIHAQLAFLYLPRAKSVSSAFGPQLSSRGARARSKDLDVGLGSVVDVQGIKSREDFGMNVVRAVGGHHPVGVGPVGIEGGDAGHWGTADGCWTRPSHVKGDDHEGAQLLW